MKNKVYVLIAAIVVVLGALFAWSQRDTKVATPVVSDGSVVHVQSEAQITTPKAARRYRIGVLYPYMANTFWVDVAYGVTAEAERAGVEITWVSADGYAHIDRQNNQIDDMVAKKVDAILLAATSYSGTSAAVERAAAAGIPVFTMVTSSNTPKVVSAVLDDDVEIGRQQARHMGAALGGKGTVAMFSGPAGAEWSMNRAKGFKEVLKAQYPAITVVAERFGDPDRAVSRRMAEDLLVAFPNVAGVFSVSDVIALGVVDALAEVPHPPKIVITSASFSREAIPYLKAGSLSLDIDENPIMLGRLGIANVVRGLNGEKVPMTVYVPNPGFTPSNIATLDVKHHWAPDTWRPR